MLTFEMSSALAVFMEAILQGLPQVIYYLDDSLVMGSTRTLAKLVREIVVA